MVKISKPKDIEIIGKEWDNIAKKREELIDLKKDLSLEYVTKPCILRNLKESNSKRVVDLGCGSGYLTHEISKVVDECWGIDQSIRSISIAKTKYSSSNLHFIASSIKMYEFPKKVDTCVANMVFMGDPQWQDSISHLYGELPFGGRLLFTITHPCFWPKYWNYDNELWFDYCTETYIEADFTISLEKSFGITTHIHRPLSQYINDLITVGFSIEKLEEPRPISEMPKEYENDYPRFLFICCKKQ